MVLRHVVDAHAFLWFLAGSRQLGAAAQTVLSDPTASLVLPAIALAEACWLVQRGRVNVGPLEDVLRRLHADRRFTVDPLDLDLVERTTRLSWNGEMHDRQIVCTALRLVDLGESVAVLTADAEIRASGLVSIIW